LIAPSLLRSAWLLAVSIGGGFVSKRLGRVSAWKPHRWTLHLTRETHASRFGYSTNSLPRRFPRDLSQLPEKLEQSEPPSLLLRDLAIAVLNAPFSVVVSEEVPRS
jgi:hypothetical protein